MAAQYRTLAEEFWRACYNLTPSGTATVSLRLADNAGAKNPDKAANSDLALWSGSVELDANSGYTLKNLLQAAGLADRLTNEGGITWIVFVNGVLLRQPIINKDGLQLGV